MLQARANERSWRRRCETSNIHLLFCKWGPMLYLQLINDISHILGQYSTATAEKQKKKIPKDKLEKLMQPLG